MLDLLNKGQITIRKVMGGWEKKSCKEGWQKKENLCKGEVKEKKILQRQLHSWAYKLYLQEGYLASHFKLQF